MVKFKMEPDSCAPGGHTMPIPGHGTIGPARTQGGGTKYPVGDGPSGKGGGHALGPNGTTGGPAGTRIKGFQGAPNPKIPKSDLEPRHRSNPMKR